ncbi:hypothetical protein AB1Y20_013422 [Prymnesium parvum]|uniref:S5 DRBM domain-containing protein n=1 Tax=Prymnesium parvum TaxID=97485 RepID=A0AB34IFT4_PRYPA
MWRRAGRLGELVRGAGQGQLVGARRALAAGRGAPRRGGHRGESRKKHNFWAKWTESSQQAFWQDVAFSQDKKNELRSRPSAMRQQMQDELLDGSEREEYDDVYFGASSPWEEEYDEYLDEDDEAEEAEADLSTYRKKTAERRRLITHRMYADEGVDSRRRAELMALIEDLGEDSLNPPPAMPDESRMAEREGLGVQMMISEQQQKQLQVCSSFIDTLKLRESGLIKPNTYFAHRLHTRMVSKVGPEGKRRSYSELVIIGNGNGTAGLATGKDLTPGGALFKATRNALKNLVHIDRFDERTIFHSMKAKFRRSILDITLRRAGSGTKCSWPLWKMMQCYGISDVAVKIHGNKNVISVCKAFHNALQRQNTPEAIAKQRGLRVLDLTPRSPKGRMGFEPEMP